MIDRKARDELIVLLENYSNGQVLAQEIEDRIPRSKDVAIDAIGNAVECFYYDNELNESGNPFLTDQQKADIKRYVLFLHSDREYCWDQPTKLPRWMLLLLPVIIVILVVVIFALFMAADGLASWINDLGYKVEMIDVFFPLLIIAVLIYAAGCWFVGKRRGVDRAVWPFYLRSDYEEAQRQAILEGREP